MTTTWSFKNGGHCFDLRCYL
ncbi:hypothetical protein LINPERHAP2_LOCUS38584 [Linum perenne]